MKLRTASRLAVVTLVVVVGGIVVLVKGIRAEPQPALSALQGTRLSGTVAPDFELTDQRGASVTLRQFRGHPVVLTFLATQCSDDCPQTAEKLQQTLQQMGTTGAGVAILAVSIDPRGDTQAAAEAFSEQHQLLDRWHFLIGSPERLAPVWAAYHIAVTSGPTAGAETHTRALYVIDKQGREQVYLGGDFAPDALATDLRILASS